MIQPLRCPNCGAPLPDTDSDRVTCTYCGTVSQITSDASGTRRPYIVSAEGVAKLNAYAQQVERQRAGENAPVRRLYVPGPGATRTQRGIWLVYMGLVLLVALVLLGIIVYGVMVVLR